MLKKHKEHLPLKLCSFNAQDLKSKFSDLNDYITEHDPDICVVTETWFNKDVRDAEFTPSGYNVFRKDRDIHFYTEGTYVEEARGGVLILCKTNLNPELYNDGEMDAEILWISINPHPKVRYLIGGCYRPERDEKT